MDNTQVEFPFLGPVKREPRLHDPAEIAMCRTKVQACRLALLLSRKSQDEVAARIPVTKGQMSRLLSGTRRWTDDVQYRFELITGSLAPSQWDARRRGLDLYGDDKARKRASLLAELDELEKAA